MRRVLSRLWESHDSLLRGLMRISNQLGLLGEIEEVGLFPLLASEMSTYILVTDGHYFPFGILDISKANECKAYRAELSAKLPGVPSYVFHGPPSLYSKIPFQARNALSLSLDDSLEKEGAQNRAFSIDEARKIVERSLPSETHVPPSAIAFFIFFANLLMAYQENQEGIPDASR